MSIYLFSSDVKYDESEYFNALMRKTRVQKFGVYQVR